MSGAEADVLGAIVVIQAVLSLSIDIEIDGRLSWRRDEAAP